ncbi:MAG: methyltransferase domain-containing protein [Candidatus Scalindua sp.]|nr:methyltransferase domain-containing protein [Candidatus Scalindua sp.]
MVKNKMPLVMLKTLLFLALFLPLFSSYISAQTRSPGELFPPDKIFLLEEPRDWQDTEEIMARLHLGAGDIVADIGAGSGYFTMPLASRVGDKGLVFAEDIQIEMINYISKKVEALELKNVRVIFGKPEDPSLLDNFFNLVFLANTYHELETPFLMLENIKKDLRYSGRLAIIDWDPAKQSPFGPPIEEKVPENTVINELERAGFELIEKHNFMSYHYFLVFRKKSY